MAVASPMRDLAAIVGADNVLPGSTEPYGRDFTYEILRLHGVADAVVRPGDAGEVAEVLAWCYDRELPVIPRGGGTGYAGGAVPVDGGVVVALDRLTRVRSFEPHWWRAEVEAGLTTATVSRLARENGLLFPPNPGAPEQSQIGGNVATNAGGPRAFKYGVAGRWVTGIEAAVAPGELVRIGGATRKDVAGYDLRNLLVGSEGTLGIITAIWLRFVPAPEASASVAAFYPDPVSGCAAIGQALGSGLVPAAVEYADAGVLDASGGALEAELPAGARFLVLLELDGSTDEVRRSREEAVEALSDGAISILRPADAAEERALWRWRAGMGPAVTAVTGGRVSEDVAVPADRLVDVVVGVTEIGARHGLPACSLGHAGDGNVHGCFLLVPGDPDQLERAYRCSDELCELALTLGGTVSGEHGIGWIKRGRMTRQWGAVGAGMHAAVKAALDPKNLLNPGKKT
jgi:glycolate dehydrogenase FAD-linked subunit